ncbi:TonB-dependent siderophore receptor [Pseudomonadota bacterium AL_CKDN230030165-1A_HGKHYDSX7]
MHYRIAPILAIMAAGALPSQALWAQTLPTDTRTTDAGAARPDAARPYVIAPGPLGDVLNAIVNGSGLALAVPAQLVEGRQSPGVNITATPTEALHAALLGTGLELVATPSGALSLRALPTTGATGAAELAPVLVSGRWNDPISEGTGEYTARAVSIGKEEVPLREIPQSVSVLTRANLDDRNAVSLGDAMEHVTGIRVFATSTGVVNLRSRGFRLNNYLVDGMPLRGGQGMWGSALLDMGLYDRVEVWRGPAGLLEGAGEPSGTINLARKRAHAETRIAGTAMVGSWDRYRGELDLTSGLNADGSLRGRVVAIHDQGRSFVDEVRQRTQTVYATLEYDFTPSTTLSAGMTQQRGESVAFAGLPLIAGGRTPDYSRSTFLGSRHGVKEDRGHSAFVELDHRFEGGGRWRTTANQYVTRNTMDRFISNSMVNAVTREFDLEGAWQKSTQINRGLDTFVTQPFEAWGRTHSFTVGANLQEFKGGQIQERYRIWRQNVDAPDNDLHLPDNDLGDPPEPRTLEYGTYASARIKPMQDLTVLVGGRLAWWKSRDPDAPQNDQSINARFVPNVGAIYDLTSQVSAYASYNRIFAPQTERALGDTFLSPRTGAQVELGLKGAFLDDRLNAHVAVFRIDDKGRAVDDPLNEDYSIAAGKVRSQGFEAELTGRVTPRWDITTGYAYTQTKHRDGLPEVVGTSFDSTFPRHQFHLWTRYRFSDQLAHGAFVGMGMRTSSGTYADYGNVRWRQGGHSVFTVQAGYAWSERLSATLTVNNVFDKRYFERYAGGSARQTYYGEPANVMLTVRAQY